MRRLSLSFAALALGLLLGGSASAQPFPVEKLPPDLRAWVPWALDGIDGIGCVRAKGAPVCVWPGRLELDLGPGGGRFQLDLSADGDATLRLPGSAEHWPQDVRLDGAPAPLFSLEHEGPQLRVARGRHRVLGRFAWSRMPESLEVPASVALVDLRLDGHPVPRPRREQGGLLWLQARGEKGEEGDSLRLQAFRRVRDGIPVFVETLLQLEVAGRAREIALPAALLPGTVPLAVSGDLPARVEGGQLRVQLRGGRFTVRVDARIEGQPKAIARPAGAPADPWPAQEVWVFAADETLRQVELSGPPAVDPSRTELPAEWRRLPAFLVAPGAALKLGEVRRGQAEPAPDALRLEREIWLDPQGRGASVRDRFDGTLRSTTRLDVVAPGSLGRVAVDGQDQLITASPVTRAAGVELRREALRLEADSRLTLGGSLPAVGWTASVERLGATLHVPPGWSLLASSGVDELPGTWTSRWTLLGFFFVLIVALSVERLLGRRQALLALAALVLIHGEPDAPAVVWLSLVAALALVRVAPVGRLAGLARLWFFGSVAVLLVVLVPFVRDQVQAALFPQTAQQGSRVALPVQSSEMNLAPAGVVGGRIGGLPAAPPQANALEERADAPAEAEAAKDLLSAGSSLSEPARAKARYSYNQALEQDPKAVLQTGPGVPNWSWRSYSLRWSGPVSRDHRMRLVLASPGVNLVLTGLRLLALGLFAFVIVVGRWPSPPVPAAPPSAPLPASPAVVLLLVAGAFLGGASAQAAEEPTPATLEQLKQRLTRPAACEPRCVTTPSLVLRLDDSRLAISAEVHVAADAAWTLPGPLGAWSPAELRVDGAPAVAVAHLGDGFLHVRLERGVHHVEASGPVPAGDSFALQFADPPRRARAEAPAWEVSGFRADGPSEPSILLTRRLHVTGRGSQGEGRYAPWLEVTRTLGFGVSWTVETTVRRLSPRGTPIALRVPLLSGEAPTRASLVVEHGEAAVSLGGDEVETSWQSVLPQSPTLTLAAPKDRPWSEVWRLQCSALWPCIATGLPPVSRVAEGVVAPEFRPWPGESLQVSLSHPEGADGQTLTIDEVALESNPGSRLERASLRIVARSSREQPLVLQLPKEAELQSLSVAGRERPSRPENGELRVTVPPGSQTILLRWQQPRGLGVHHVLPRVSLSAPAVNVTQQVTLPPDRWLILTHGPAWGPAVLFWPYVLFLLALAWALGRTPGSPLDSRQWALLGLGLSQLPAAAALVVGAFVFALAWRRRRPLAGAVAFDLLQLLLAGWTLVSLGLLYVAIHQGLLFRPDMQVAGGGSSDAVLRWYADRSGADLPAAGVFSLPLWVYRVAMLLWALWLAASLVRAFGWGWRAFGEGGLWKPLARRKAVSTLETDGKAGGTPQ